MHVRRAPLEHQHSLVENVRVLDLLVEPARHPNVRLRRVEGGLCWRPDDLRTERLQHVHLERLKKKRQKTEIALKNKPRKSANRLLRSRTYRMPNNLTNAVFWPKPKPPHTRFRPCEKGAGRSSTHGDRRSKGCAPLCCMQKWTRRTVVVRVLNTTNKSAA